MKTTKTKTTTKAIHIAAAENVTALFELAEKDEGKARIYFLALAMQLKAEGVLDYLVGMSEWADEQRKPATLILM
jgi:hypothetical protein